MTTYRLALLSLVLAIVGLSNVTSSAGQGGATGKLILSGDLTLFGSRGADLCTMRNRFKRGEAVGFRLTAVDGGTGEIEKSADVVVHLAYAGKTIDVPARYRGYDPPKPFGPIPYLWTAKWIVPADATTGILRFNVTAKDNKGRTAQWSVFQNNEAALLTIVE